MNLRELNTSVLTAKGVPNMKFFPHSTLNPTTSSMIGFKSQVQLSLVFPGIRQV